MANRSMKQPTIELRMRQLKKFCTIEKMKSLEPYLKLVVMTKFYLKLALNKTHSGPRSSKYRGVSLNGKKYQTLVMGFKKKAYRGRHNTEMEAAMDYDKNAILSQGLHVSTNSS